MQITRRGVLKISAIVPAAAILPDWLAEPLLAQTVAPLVRYDVNSTDPKAAEALQAYKQAVVAMKARKTNDPTSWQFQANMHSWPGQFGMTASDPELEFQTAFSPSNVGGLSDEEKARRLKLARDLWGTCIHGEPEETFLPWHRMYLYFFERIVRAAVGLNESSRLGLLYWNWTKDRIMPTAFREAVNGSQDNNPLYWNIRSASATSSSDPFPIDPELVSVSKLLDYPDFSPTFNPDAPAGFSNELESGPHGQVHVYVGVPPRGMGFFEEAGRDPIFWLHHCNID